MNKKRNKKSGFNPKCLLCGDACCRYFTIKIPTPRSIIDFDNLLWMLHHEKTKVFKDSTGWYLLIYNPCIHHMDNGGCDIYDSRPQACREHSDKDCEFDYPIADASTLYFENSTALDKYCRKRFKTWDKR